jgi:hypothetical protein
MKGITLILLVIALVPAFCVITPQFGIQEYMYTDTMTVSATRCVMSDIGYEDLTTLITDMRVYDITNQAGPVSGYEYHHDGGILNPTLRENLLIYGMQNPTNYTYKIDDLSDINNPANLFSITVPQCYASAVHQNYLLMGMANGDIQIYDFNDTGNVHLANTFNVLPSIWRIYDLGDSLAVSCGNYSYPTVKIMTLDEQNCTLTETGTFDPPAKDTYIGNFSGKIILRGENEHTYIYGWEESGMLMLNDMNPTSSLQSIITSNHTLYATDDTRRVRVIRYNDDTMQLDTIGTYAFPNEYYSSLSIVATQGNSLVCHNNSYYYYWLDVSNLEPSQDVISQFDSEIPINKITCLDYNGGYLYGYTNTDNRLLEINADHSLTLNCVLESEPYMWNYQARGHLLYGLTTMYDQPIISVLDCSVPSQPIIYQQTYCESTELFCMSNDVIYAGWRNQPNKYRIEPQGFLSYEDSLSFYYYGNSVSDWMDFTDLIEYGGNDFGVGTGLISLYGDVNPLFYFRQTGFADGTIYQAQRGKFIYGYQSHLYSIGNQLVTYQQQDDRIPVAESIGFDTFLYRDVVDYAGYYNYLIVAYTSSNRIIIYDLSNPSEPVIARIIQQTCPPLSMCLAGDILYVANGAYGIAGYDLSGLTPVEDNVVTPAVSLLNAYPNPFSNNLSLAFELKQAEPVSLKIYNVKGQLVKNLDSGVMSKGKNQIQWDGRDETGKTCAGGIYFARLSTKTNTAVKKILKLK